MVAPGPSRGARAYHWPVPWPFGIGTEARM